MAWVRLRRTCPCHPSNHEPRSTSPMAAGSRFLPARRRLRRGRARHTNGDARVGQLTTHRAFGWTWTAASHARAVSVALARRRAEQPVVTRRSRSRVAERAGIIHASVYGAIISIVTIRIGWLHLCQCVDRGADTKQRSRRPTNGHTSVCQAGFFFACARSGTLCKRTTILLVTPTGAR